MTELPPDENPADGVDDRYRLASSREVSRPSESVRRAVLRHAADLSAQRASAKQPVDIDFKQRDANQAWRRPAAYGGLAAAALAGLLIAPRFLTPSPPPVPTARLGPAAPAPLAESAGAPTDAPAAAPAGGLGENQRRAFAAKSNAQSAPRAEHFAASDGASVESAPPPAAPAASLGARAAAQPTDSASALRQSAALGDLPRLRALIAEQPEIDARDSSGRSALMLAVLFGQADAVNALLASGADANAADANGTTPLQAALAHNRSAIAAALRRAGAR